MPGILYGVGVGPGDPEYLTLKAIRTMKENQVIAAPGEDVKETTAFKIAVQAVPEIAEKELLPVFMPMVMDRNIQRENHKKGAAIIEEVLDQGKNVVFLTLGDPTVYSTFSYVQEIVEAHGYETRLVSGITSFCAAAARMNLPLVEWQEPLHIIPAVHKLDALPKEPGNYVLMKSGSKMNQVKAALAESGLEVSMVENCGMPNEKIYRSLSEIPDDAGYFSLIIAKEKLENHD
ncbi:MAG: precorrin-2 C(20)-methyltransferase [Eubacteriales bacterium]|nr:precorrin-2 C(20)-methyltransferase [Eubacteriales bacterium]